MISALLAIYITRTNLMTIREKIMKLTKFQKVFIKRNIPNMIEFMKEKHNQDYHTEEVCRKCFEKAMIEGNKQKWSEDETMGAVINLMKGTKYHLQA